MKKNDVVIGVDLGGTHVSCGLVDLKGNIFGIYEISVDRTEKPEKIISHDLIGIIKKCIDQKSELKDRIKGIGIGIPGRTDSKNGICVFAPNFNWRNVDIRTPLEQTLNLPTFILNDARAMALGEKYFGNGKGVDDFISIAIGTGIGGGIVAGGTLLMGADEAAGEIGHITVDPDGPQCACGARGCVETLASRLGIVSRAEKMISEGGETELTKERLSSKGIYEAALRGDKLSMKIWEDTGIYLGRAISSIANIVNPRRILFSGRVSGAIDFFLPALKKELASRTKMAPVDKIEFMRAKFEDNAGIIGSAGRAFEQLGLI